MLVQASKKKPARHIRQDYQGDSNIYDWPALGPVAQIKDRDRAPDGAPHDFTMAAIPMANPTLAQSEAV